MPGHWEGVLIKGKANASSVETLAERTSGYLMLVKMHDTTATSAMEGYSAALNLMPLAIAQKHDLRPRAGNGQAYRNYQANRGEHLLPRSAQPMAAVEKREHQWAIRQYLSKGTDLSIHSQDAQGKRFDFKWPIEVMGVVIEKAMAMRHDPPTLIQ